MAVSLAVSTHAMAAPGAGFLALIALGIGRGERGIGEEPAAATGEVMAGP